MGFDLSDTPAPPAVGAAIYLSNTPTRATCLRIRFAAPFSGQAHVSEPNRFSREPAGAKRPYRYLGDSDPERIVKWFIR